MKLAVITGASSGLGEVFARRLAAQGWQLLLAARRAEKLEAIRRELGDGVECFPCDLASTEEAERLARRLEELEPELLVNNAGFGTMGKFHETAYERQAAMVNVHVLATMRLTRAVLPGMVARGRGAVINVSSVAGFFRSAGNVSYCATKGWMNDFTEGLRIELDAVGSPVVVQALCPGFTYTEFHDTLGVDRKMIPGLLWMDAGYVVDESLRALERGELFVIPNWKYQFAAAFAELLPVSWRLALAKASPHKRGRT
ncbi:MAG: SDR family oxidoreductase [Acidobacteria bacterium]|nr:SDR family oxidoreductase [Acidobacteriota bacterium]